MTKKEVPCYFRFHGVKGDFCRGTTIYPCPKNETECPFYKSEAQYKASLEQARKNFKNRYGYDGYGTFKYTENYTQEALKGERLRTDDVSDSSGSSNLLDRPYL